MRDTELEIEERPGPDGCLCVALRGELDLASAGQVEDHLRILRRSGESIQLELSQLEFIDCTGMRILTSACAAAAADGWDFEIRGELTPPVRRMFELLAEDLLPPVACGGGGGARRTL